MIDKIIQSDIFKIYIVNLVTVCSILFFLYFAINAIAPFVREKDSAYMLIIYTAILLNILLLVFFTDLKLIFKIIHIVLYTIFIFFIYTWFLFAFFPIPL